MAIVFFRIGGIPNAQGYDNAVYDSSIETTEPIKAGDPIDPTDVVNLRSLKVRGITVVSAANPVELNLEAGSPGDLIVCQQINGGGAQDLYTIYGYDSNGPGTNAPYIMAAAAEVPPTGAERWIALLGRYSVVDQFLNAALRAVGLYIMESDLTNTLQLNWGEASGADRVLSILVNGADRTISLTGNLTVDAASRLNQDLRTTQSPTFAGLTLTGFPDETFTVMTAIQAGGAGPLGIQYKNKPITVTKGIVTTLAAESGWNDI